MVVRPRTHAGFEELATTAIYLHNLGEGSAEDQDHKYSEMIEARRRMINDSSHREDEIDTSLHESEPLVILSSTILRQVRFIVRVHKLSSRVDSRIFRPLFVCPQRTLHSLHARLASIRAFVECDPRL